MKEDFDEWGLNGIITVSGIGILHCQQWSNREILFSLLQIHLDGLVSFPLKEQKFTKGGNE